MFVRPRSRILPLLLLASLPFSGSVGLAAGGTSLDEAVTAAQERYHARVVKAAVVENAGRKIYVLRLLGGDGRVWTIRIDAATGLEQNH
jgi:hypothetical protein